MIIYDTLIQFPHVNISENSRENNSLSYARCHSYNSNNTKRNIANKRYFVFSNKYAKNCILLRTTDKESINTYDTETNDIKIVKTLSYDIKDYEDYLVFSGSNNIENNIDSIDSESYLRYELGHCKNIKHLNEKYVKKICVSSKNSKKHIFVYKTLFSKVNNILSYKEKFIDGIGGRKTYGCGLIIPEKVYTTICNFI